VSNRRLPLRVSFVVSLALAVSPLVGRTVVAQLPSVPGTLEIRNNGPESVRVEVRVGPSQNCEENPSQGVRGLRRGATWAVVSDEFVCWRREQLSVDPAALWTPWEQAQLARDQVREVSL